MSSDKILIARLLPINESETAPSGSLRHFPFFDDDMFLDVPAPSSRARAKAAGEGGRIRRHSYFQRMDALRFTRAG